MKKETNAVICSLNSQYIHSSLAPWCLLAGLQENAHDGINAVVVEGTINETSQSIAERILSHSPTFLGFCCYIWNITEVFELVKLIKQELSECVVVLGGPEVSYRAEEVLLSSPLVDYVISGEGEKPLSALLRAIHRGTDIAEIPGLCYRKGSEIIIAEPYTPDDIPPSPYTKQYLDALNGRIAYLETSRGCPYSCAFCLSGRCGGVRYYDLERVKKEILFLAISGTQTIKLVDRTFNAHRGRANEIFSFIIKRYGKEIPQGVCFHFEIAADLLDENTIKLLGTAPAGSMQFEIGLQSFNPKTLSAVSRKTDVERLKHNISALLANRNAHIHIDLIAGLPYENMASFIESFNTAFSLRPHMLQLGFLKLLHGSPMRENPELFPCEYNQMPPYEVTKTPWLPEEELNQLHYTEHALNLLYNRGRFSRTLNYLLSSLNQNAFELFSEFGLFLSQEGQEAKSLDDFTALVFSFYSGKSNVDKSLLRDSMVCDRLATNASGRIPKVLQIHDRMLKTAIRALEREHGSKKAVKRGYALLYSENCLAYTDYEDKNPVTGEYILKKYPFVINNDVH
jgi:Fe-S oxidoreductase